MLSLPILNYKLLCVFIIVLLFYEAANTSDDLPAKENLRDYFNSLGLLLDYLFGAVLRNDSKWDENLLFSVTLAYDNIEKAIAAKQKLPSGLKNELESSQASLNLLKEKLRTRLKRNTTKTEYLNLELSLFVNTAYWIKQMRKYRIYEHPNVKSVHDIYVNVSPRPLSATVKNVWRLSFRKHIDNCFILLAKNPVNTPKCSLDDICYASLVYGPNFDEILSYRLLLLLMAHHGRGCSIFSKHTDIKKINKLCANAFNETNYFVNTKHEATRLVLATVLSHMSLCALAGHAEILRREWIETVLKRQTQYGCISPFGNKIIYDKKYKIEMNDMCDLDVLTDGLAVSSLASVVRYIVERYY